MQILSHSHREKLLVEWQKQHKWGKHTDVGFVRDSVGQRLGVLGYGYVVQHFGFGLRDCSTYSPAPVYQIEKHILIRHAVQLGVKVRDTSSIFLLLGLKSYLLDRRAILLF